MWGFQVLVVTRQIVSPAIVIAYVCWLWLDNRASMCDPTDIRKVQWNTNEKLFLHIFFSVGEREEHLHSGTNQKKNAKNLPHRADENEKKKVYSTAGRRVNELKRETRAQTTIRFTLSGRESFPPHTHSLWLVRRLETRAPDYTEMNLFLVCWLAMTSRVPIIITFLSIAHHRSVVVALVKKIGETSTNHNLCELYLVI